MKRKVSLAVEQASEELDSTASTREKTQTECINSASSSLIRLKFTRFVLVYRQSRSFLFRFCSLNIHFLLGFIRCDGRAFSYYKNPESFHSALNTSELRPLS